MCRLSPARAGRACWARCTRRSERAARRAAHLGSQTENDEPQPQVVLAFGFLISFTRLRNMISGLMPPRPADFAACLRAVGKVISGGTKP
jgi:hypothetical protein